MQGSFKLPKSLSYKGDAKNWHNFKQQFEVYMKLTGLEKNDEETKVNIFLNIGGEEAFEIYNNLQLSPEQKKNYNSVLEAFENYCVSKQNVIYKSFKFFTRVQQPGELFNDFYSDLQNMASYCNFGEQRDRLVRDRIIAGIRNQRLQEEFLKAPDLDLEEVISKCLEDESEKIRSGQFKCEVESNGGDDDILAEEESNNNLDELIAQDMNGSDDYMFDEVHVPDEIILNEIRKEDSSKRVNQENSTEPPQTKTEDLDVKPSNIMKASTKMNSKSANKSSSSSRKGKILEKRKTIQMKIAEIKNKLSKDIKKEVDGEQMGIRQRNTRSRARNMEVKKEPVEPLVQEDEVDEEEEEQSVENVENFSAEEEDEYQEMEQDPYVYREEHEDMVNGNDSTYFHNFETITEEEGLDEDEQIEVDYITNENINTPKTGTKRKRRTGNGGTGRKREEVKIVKVKRGNMPPLILKTVRKKKFLLGKMPYPCKKCDSSFWTSGQLERHQIVHILKKVPPPVKAPKKIYKCEECGKEFKKICDLERHTRVHTGEKPSVCNICNKRFQQAYNLNKHLLIHTQEKNFECVICQKRFGRNDVLNRHVLTHSIDKPFHCSICSKTFIRNTQLNLHLRKHHELEEEPKTPYKKKSLIPAATKSSD